jgi:hypothetical protein
LKSLVNLVFLIIKFQHYLVLLHFWVVSISLPKISYQLLLHSWPYLIYPNCLKSTMASMTSLFLRPLDSLPSSGRQPTLEKHGQVWNWWREW